jgi:hypothetical protein
MQSTMTMLVTPPAMRGRMMGLLSVCIGATTPLGTLEIGVLAAAFTVPSHTPSRAMPWEGFSCSRPPWR